MTIPQWLRSLFDIFVTFVIWMYFTFGFFFLFFPFYLFSFIFSENREIVFQKITHRFFKGFFILLKSITPELSLQIDQEVYAIRSSVIVCNHLSYLDPILLVSLFEKQKSIVKNTFLKVPFLGWVIKTCGYLFSTKDERFPALMLEPLENMEKYLAGGGNFFIFPEGTRSRDGKIGRLNKGGLTIAKRCRAPIEVLMITNTNRLFEPGRFLFRTSVPNIITVKRIGSIHPDYSRTMPSTAELLEQVRQLFEQRQHD